MAGGTNRTKGETSVKAGEDREHEEGGHVGQGGEDGELRGVDCCYRSLEQFDVHTTEKGRDMLSRHCMDRLRQVESRSDRSGLRDRRD